MKKLCIYDMLGHFDWFGISLLFVNGSLYLLFCTVLCHFPSYLWPFPCLVAVKEGFTVLNCMSIHVNLSHFTTGSFWTFDVDVFEELSAQNCSWKKSPLSVSTKQAAGSIFKKAITNSCCLETKTKKITTIYSSLLFSKPHTVPFWCLLFSPSFSNFSVTKVRHTSRA